MPSRNSAWSSAMRTRILDMGRSAFHEPLGCGCQWNVHVDPRPLPGLGMNRQRAVQQGGPFLHAEESESARVVNRLAELLRLKSVAVILDRQAHLGIGKCDGDLDALRVGMARDVCDRLLPDAE